MATQTHNYSEYFNAIQVTIDTTSYTNNIIPPESDTTCYEMMGLVLNELLQDNYNTYEPGPAVPYTISHDLPVRFYTGTLTATIKFTNRSHSRFWDRQISLGFSDGSLNGYSLSDVQHDIANELVDKFGEYNVGGAYFTTVEYIGYFYFAERKGNYTVKILRDGNGNVMSCQVHLTNSGMSGSTNNMNRIVITMSVYSRTFSITYANRTVRNLTQSGSQMLLSKILNYRFYPKWLESIRDEFYERGYRGNNSSTSLNHQDYIPNSAKNTIEGIIDTYTRTGTITTQYNSFSNNMVYSFTQGYNRTGNYEFTWKAQGYNFYRNSGRTQDVTVDPYDKVNFSGTTTLNIYPKAVSTATKEKIALVLYDEDEGDNSYTASVSVDLLENYKVPPTDVITPYDTNLYTYHQKTEGTYHFAPTGEGFKVQYNNTWYYPEPESNSPSNINYTATASALIPSVTFVTFTSQGENLPSTPEGWIMHSCENHVTIDNREVACSVRYYLTGNVSITRGSVEGSGTSRRRTSFYYVGVKKNTMDFINRISGWDPNMSRWSDTIGGITYTQPIAYANKVSTFNDLLDKMTCFHACAYQRGTSAIGDIPLYDVKTYLNTQLWTNLMSSAYSNSSNTYDPIRYRYISIGGRTYSEHNWPMRWYSYPTWTSATQSAFSYRSGLVMKYPPSWTQYESLNADLVIFLKVTQNDWEQALYTDKTPSGSGMFFVSLIKYNGLELEYAYPGTTWPFTKIYSGNNSQWNRDRRTVGNYENLLYEWYEYEDYNFGLANRIYDWLRDTVTYFNNKTSLTEQRFISYTGTTVTYVDIPEEGDTMPVTDKQHRQATNEILFTLQKQSES